jgi:molybdopterin molybdotransferase
MLSVDEALRLVLEHALPLPAVWCTDLADACGRVLAEPIVSEVDSPPHDKAIVDGYALRAADVTASAAELAILEEVTAGATPTKVVERGAATRIMTGAPLPPGADAVVMVEKTQTVSDRVRILQSNVRPGQNIMRKAAAMQRGQTVLQPGSLLRPIEIGLLAEVGRRALSVISRPRLAVLVTGNELAEQGPPGPGQIYNSNGPMLTALAGSAEADATNLGIARDNEDDLHAHLTQGLGHDVLLVSGGVSAGVLDLVPAGLERLAVKQIFHKVDLKPGKPLWFGIKQREDHPTLVFGLPGNPVSSLVCFVLFVLPAIQKLRGLEPTGLGRTAARLASDFQQRGDRPTYWPAKLIGNEVAPLAWRGSGDLRTLADANSLIFFPPGERLFRAGEPIDALLLI